MLNKLGSKEYKNRKKIKISIRVNIDWYIICIRIFIIKKHRYFDGLHLDHLQYIKKD